MLSREGLEKNQIPVYIIAIILGGIAGLIFTNIGGLLESIVSFAIAVLLFSMFCQIPFLKLREALRNGRFIGMLLLVNFVCIPLLVFLLIKLFPQPGPVLIGVCLVLLTPCIDYVIVFTQLGKGNEKLILASTPVLFVVQMMMLPLYLWLFIGSDASQIVSLGPFVEAFTYMILIPLGLALVLQFFAKKSLSGSKSLDFTAWLPVPLMALVLFLVIGSQIERVMNDFSVIVSVIPVYILFHLLAPSIARFAASLVRMEPFDGRALLFSAGTRNSLVVLPLALTLPGEIATIAAAVIVTQTIVELVAELIYIRVIPKFYADRAEKFKNY